MLSRFSCVFATLWTVAHQAPLSIGFSRQEYWSGLPYPPPGDLPDPGIKLHLLCLLHWQVGFFVFLTTNATWEVQVTAHILPNWANQYSDLNSAGKSLVNSNLETQLGKRPGLCIHLMGETLNCSFGGLPLITPGHKWVSS